MKKYETIKSTRKFNDIINKGNKVKSKYFILCSEENKELDFSMFGVAVGKKTGNAVERNKIKRRIRFLIDNNKKSFKNNCLYIIIGKKECKNVKFLDLEKDFAKLLIKGEQNEK